MSDELNKIYREVVGRFELDGPELVALWGSAGVKVRTKGKEESSMTLFHCLRFLRSPDHPDYLPLTSNKLKRFLSSLIAANGGVISSMSLDSLMADLEQISSNKA